MVKRYGKHKDTVFQIDLRLTVKILHKMSWQIFTYTKWKIETLKKGVHSLKVDSKRPERRHWRHSGVSTGIF